MPCFILLNYFYLISFKTEAIAKLLKARGSRHSGQAKHDPESSIFEQFWIPAFAGMTEQMTFAKTSTYNYFRLFWLKKDSHFFWQMKKFKHNLLTKEM